MDEWERKYEAREAARLLAATVVRADRLRTAGRSDLEERRLIVQLQRALGMKPEKPAPPPKEDFTEAMRQLATPHGAER